MTETVSIVVTSYNYQAFIPQTLASIAAQSFSNWEALIVDDGSTDNSLSIIRGFCEQDSRFRLLQHQGGCNRGLSESLQLGLQQAAGDWVAFCESDDWWEPSFLEAVHARARANPRAGVVFTDVVLEGRSETMEAHCLMVRQHFRADHKAIDMYLQMRNAVPTLSCAMVRTGLIRSCDFAPRFPPSLDMWLWAQLVGNTEFDYVDAPLCHWRQHEQSYMKKEVAPAALDMAKVLAFHDQIRSLFSPAITPGLHPPRAKGALGKLRTLVGSWLK